MERETGYLGFGPLDILKRYLTKNEIICHPLIDYLSGNIPVNVFIPNVYLPDTNIIKLRYEIVN